MNATHWAWERFPRNSRYAFGLSYFLPSLVTLVTLKSLNSPDIIATWRCSAILTMLALASDASFADCSTACWVSMSPMVELLSRESGGHSCETNDFHRVLSSVRNALHGPDSPPSKIL